MPIILYKVKKHSSGFIILYSFYDKIQGEKQMKKGFFFTMGTVGEGFDRPSHAYKLMFSWLFDKLIKLILLPLSRPLEKRKTNTYIVCLFRLQSTVVQNWKKVW